MKRRCKWTKFPYQLPDPHNMPCVSVFAVGMQIHPGNLTAQIDLIGTCDCGQAGDCSVWQEMQKNWTKTAVETTLPCPNCSTCRCSWVSILSQSKVTTRSFDPLLFWWPAAYILIKFLWNFCSICEYWTVSRWVLHNIHFSHDLDPRFKTQDQESERLTKKVKFVASSKGQGKSDMIVIQEGNEGSFVLAASNDCYIFYCFLSVPHCILKGIAM